MSDIYNITAEHPDDCDCAHCYDPVRRVADLQTQRDTLARALLESQAALAAAEEGRLAALDIAKGAYEERDEARAALAAANSRVSRLDTLTVDETKTLHEADVRELIGPALADQWAADIGAGERRLMTCEAERDALRVDLARVTAERDDLDVRWKAEIDHANTWAARYRAESADLAAARQEVEALRAQVEALPRYEGKLLDAVPMTRDPAGRWVSRAEVIAALSAAPAPTPADTKEDDRG